MQYFLKENSSVAANPCYHQKKVRYLQGTIEELYHKFKNYYKDNDQCKIGLTSWRKYIKSNFSHVLKYNNPINSIKNQRKEQIYVQYVLIIINIH